MDIKVSEFKYKYETHLHTSDASLCAKNTPVEMVKACRAAGYTGTFITNHAWGGNTCVDRSLPWREWVKAFTDGYYEAREWGEANDFKVFFGFEAGFEGTEFLIYGISPEWLFEHPEFHDADIKEQYDIVHAAGGMVIQAHPFRDEFYIPVIRIYSKYIDGVEGINATHSSHLSQSHNVKEWNDLAIKHALRHEFPMTAGSDVHTTLMFGGGVMTKKPLECDRDFIDLVLSEEMYLLHDGENVYTRHGELIK